MAFSQENDQYETSSTQSAQNGNYKNRIDQAGVRPDQAIEQALSFDTFAAPLTVEIGTSRLPTDGRFRITATVGALGPHYPGYSAWRHGLYTSRHNAVPV
jgi:hypothetical protein